MVAHQTALNH